MTQLGLSIASHSGLPPARIGEIADGFVAHGDAAACAAHVAQYRAAGVDLPVLFPMPVGGNWQYDEVISSFAAGAGWPTPGQDGENL